MNKDLDIVSRFQDKKVLVLGDVMLDEYIVGHVSRILSETLVPVVTRQEAIYSPGGAANAAMNIASLGGKAYLMGLVGDDREGKQLESILDGNGVNIEGVVADPKRPTTLPIWPVGLPMISITC